MTQLPHQFFFHLIIKKKVNNKKGDEGLALERLRAYFTFTHIMYQDKKIKSYISKNSKQQKSKNRNTSACEKYIGTQRKISKYII
jgi:hemerythrin